MLVDVSHLGHSAPTMRILFATGHPYLPELRGGAQATMDELAVELRERGHEVSILSGLLGKGMRGFRDRVLLKLKLSSCPATRVNGFRVHRAWFAWEAAADVAGRVAPDVVVVHSGFPVRMALAFERLGLPVVLYLHNVEFDNHGGPFESLRCRHFVANSKFTAARYRSAYGIESVVIHPVMRRENYAAIGPGRAVTLINPIREKGVDIVIAVARACPDIPFLLVESWDLGDDRWAALECELAQLGNVRLLRHVSDMQSIYAQTRILMAPSRWEEAWGRIAPEAHYSGIPVVASNRGGLAEAVGAGGILLDPDGPIDVWVEAVRSLWCDERRYRELSAAAAACASRPEVDPARQVHSFIEVLERVTAPSDPARSGLRLVR